MWRGERGTYGWWSLLVIALLLRRVALRRVLLAIATGHHILCQPLDSPTITTPLLLLRPGMAETKGGSEERLSGRPDKRTFVVGIEAVGCSNCTEHCQ